jgi:hypothetical protein
VAAQPSQPAGHWNEASLDDYRSHLATLITLTQACAKARDLKACDPTLVGPDDRISNRVSDRVTGGAGTPPRLVRYGWLRVLFSNAEEPDKAKAAPDSKKPTAPPGEMTLPPPPTTSQLLEDAQSRLAHDLAQAAGAPNPAPNYAKTRENMRQVLAGREFRGLQQPTEADSALEKVGNWLNRFFASVGKLRARSAWVGRVLVWGFILAVGIGITWGLMQLERRWRVRLVPDSAHLSPGAPSVRDWQLWLEDARRAAAAGQWREAIHFVYWAAIARLESRRLWPADRARTPREYLALLAPQDPRQASLASLTGSFERTWYGGRQAREADYRHAESLADTLISGNLVSAKTADRPTVSESGAR